jgi:hypothetical protein
MLFIYANDDAVVCTVLRMKILTYRGLLQQDEVALQQQWRMAFIQDGKRAPE